MSTQAVPLIEDAADNEDPIRRAKALIREAAGLVAGECSAMLRSNRRTAPLDFGHEIEWAECGGEAIRMLSCASKSLDEFLKRV